MCSGIGVEKQGENAKKWYQWVSRRELVD